MLTEEQISTNWDRFNNYIRSYIGGSRRDKLLDLYNKLEETIVTYPASSHDKYHNAIPGGYIDHILRVTDICLELDQVWKKYGGNVNHTDEELVFSCINHDLGKLGEIGKPFMSLNDNDWEIKNRGALYKFNTEIPFITVPDRTLFLLQQHGIEYTTNEFLAIKLHDGLYDESNKQYLITYQAETKPRSYLIYLIHQADLAAARIEFEKWFYSGNKKKPGQIEQVKSKVDFKTKALISTGKGKPEISSKLSNLLKNI